MLNETSLKLGYVTEHMNRCPYDNLSSYARSAAPAVSVLLPTGSQASVATIVSQEGLNRTRVVQFQQKCSAFYRSFIIIMIILINHSRTIETVVQMPLLLLNII